MNTSQWQVTIYPPCHEGEAEPMVSKQQHGTTAVHLGSCALECLRSTRSEKARDMRATQGNAIQCHAMQCNAMMHVA